MALIFTLNMEKAVCVQINLRIKIGENVEFGEIVVIFPLFLYVFQALKSDYVLTVAR